MKYSDIVPRASEFTLSSLPDMRLRLRPIDLDDEQWLRDNFPNLQSDFETVNMTAISQIVWHQLENECRKFFASKEIEVVNDDGETKVFKVGGLKAFRAYVLGPGDKLTLLKSLLETIGLSRPLIEKVEAEAEAAEVAEKKSIASPIGDSSLTYSPVSTAGIPETLGDSP